MSKQVLVFPTQLLHDLGYFEGLKTGSGVEDYFARILRSKTLFYMDRDKAEVFKDHVQLIPYCVFLYRDMVFYYRRNDKGGESRLHNTYSIGVGGHIEKSDGDLMGENAYMNAFWRELAEEVCLTEKYSNEVVGLINDTSTEVGRVHFGVVHMFRLPLDFQMRSFSLKNDPTLENGTWQFIAHARKHSPGDGEFENWSKLVLRANIWENQ